MGEADLSSNLTLTFTRPLFNHNGRVVASVSISALTIGLAPEKEKLFEGIVTKITTRSYPKSERKSQSRA